MPQLGTPEEVGEWSLRRRAHYREYLWLLRRRELQMVGIDPDKREEPEDDDKPSWGVETTDEHGSVPWSTDQFAER